MGISTSLSTLLFLLNFFGNRNCAFQRFVPCTWVACNPTILFIHSFTWQIDVVGVGSEHFACVWIVFFSMAMHNNSLHFFRIRALELIFVYYRRVRVSWNLFKEGRGDTNFLLFWIRNTTKSGSLCLLSGVRVPWNLSACIVLMGIPLELFLEIYLRASYY